MVHVTLALSSVLAFVRLHKKSLLPLSFLLIILFAVCRYQYGNDYVPYYESFIQIHNGEGSPFPKEVLFTLLNKICPSFYILIAVTSSFFLLVIYKLIRSNIDDKFVGLAVFILLFNPYIYLVYLSAIRQSIAMALFIIAIYYSRQKKIVPYVLLVLTATLFHTSAIILLPLYFVANESKLNRTQFVILLVVVALFLFDSTLLKSTVAKALELFDNRNYDLYFRGESGNSLRATALSAVYFLYTLINLRKLSGATLMYAKLYLIGTILALFAYHFSMLTRVQMYFDLFSVVALPGIIKCNKEGAYGNLSRGINVYMFPILLGVIYVLRYYSFFMNPLWSSFVTYQTIWGAL